MKKLIHSTAGTLVILCIATFWLATAGSELFGSGAAIRQVKIAIPWGFVVLIPALMATGGTGWSLAQSRRGRLVSVKIRRMRWIAANGILILMPAAFFLAHKARAHEFDGAFFTVQILELVVGLVNIALLCLNMRDGFKMKGRFRRGLP